MLTHLELKQYRSHTSLQLSFSQKTNVIIGLNGAGKTNILEAISYGYIGNSYRAKDIHLIQDDTKQARIHLTFSNEEQRDIRLEIDPVSHKVKKNFTINNKKYSRLGFAQLKPVVLFEPDFMQILSRGPDSRREYFDAILSNTLSGYKTQLNKYKRVVSQRNTLLKHKPSKDELFVWDVKLSQLGALIGSRRQQLINKFNEKISDTYSELSDTPHTIEIIHHSRYTEDSHSERLFLDLQKNIYTDIERGYTTCGPHRDDFSFNLNHTPASSSASRGENRTILLALKILEAQLIEVIYGKKPLLLLDDVFSELDEIRQTKLIEFFKNNQVIITTTNITPLMKGISGKIIEIS